jgi:hypothetical protein
MGLNKNKFLRFFILCLLQFFVHANQKVYCGEYGYFSGNPEGALEGKRWFQLTKDFEYTDPDGITWRASPPHRSDGTSIPRVFWIILGHPFGNNQRYAAILHDYFCDKRYPTWEMVHRMFYNALRARGVSERRAQILYLAVYHFGPRWQAPLIPAECQLGVPQFEPLNHCIMNNTMEAGLPLAPLEPLNQVTLERFLKDLEAKGFQAEVDELRSSAEVREILHSNKD